MMLPDFRKYILPPDTRISAEAWKDWQISYVSAFTWIHMTETPCSFFVASGQTVSKDCSGRATDSCYSISDWIQGLSTGQEAKRKLWRSLLNSMRCSCRVWRSLPDMTYAGWKQNGQSLRFVHFVEIFCGYVYPPEIHIRCLSTMLKSCQLYLKERSPFVDSSTENLKYNRNIPGFQHCYPPS